MTPPNAIVVGGAITALSIARSLDAAGVPVDVLDVPYSPARHSRSVRGFVDVGREDPQSRMLAWLRRGPGGAVLLAGSDEGVELIARHREELQSLGYLLGENDWQTVLMMLDKARTYELARAHGIAAPRVMSLRTEAEVELAIDQLEFPCVLKPVHSHVFVRKTQSRAKVEFINGPAELRERVSSLRDQDVEMLVTEVIVGVSDEFVSYFGYLDESGEPLLTVTKRKLRQQPPGFGLGTLHEMSVDPEVAEAGLRFLRAAGYRGLGNVEFKRDAADGALKLIECNPRLTMSNELIRRSGLDLAYFCYCRAAGLPTPSVDGYRVGMRLWDPVKDARAFASYRRMGELSSTQWVRSLLHPLCLPTFRLTDPLPALDRASWMIRGATLTDRASAPVTSTTHAEKGGEPRSATIRQDGEMVSGPIERLARSGQRGRAVAARLDLARATGAGPLWRRVRAERELAALGEGARDGIYERIWRQAGEACGARLSELAPGLFELSNGESVTRVYHQTVELDDPVTLRVALDKAVVHRLMLDAGLDVTERCEWRFDDPGPAIAFLERAGGPCVVKPAAGTGGGHGVTPGIATVAELMRARLHAAVAGERLLIERQAAGPVYRLLFLEGELLDVIKSVPANVTGDGRSTIEELIRAENARRIAAGGAAGLSRLGMNLDTVLTLRRAGLTLSSIPATGERLALRAATNNNAARDNETWRGDVSPDVVDAARAAAGAVGLRLAGVDVISPDISRPLAATGGIVTEVNGTPGLHHHYLVADADRATPVAVPILRRLLTGEPHAPQPGGSRVSGSVRT